MFIDINWTKSSVKEYPIFAGVVLICFVYDVWDALGQ